MSIVTTPASEPPITGETPPTTLVPPPYGTTAAPADSAQLRPSDSSRSSRGRSTTSGTVSNRPRNARTMSL
jgi:hypothetical protein